MHIGVLSDGYPPWERGGAQKIAAQLAHAYHTRDHRVSVITTVTDRREVGRSLIDGVDISRIYSPKPRPLLPYLTVHNPFTVPACRRVLDELSPDVVHAHNTHWLSNRVLRAAADGRPVVKTYHDAGTVAHGDFDRFVGRVPIGRGPVPRRVYAVSAVRQAAKHGLRYNPIRNRSNRRVHERYVDVGVAVSRELRRALAVNGIPCHHVIRNGVNIGRWDATDGDTFCSQYGLNGGEIILFGGRTSYTKGGYHLAKAFARVTEAVENPVWLVVTGDAEYVPVMRRAAASAGAAIVATGWLDPVEYRNALDAAAVLACPSMFLDPFPTGILEAFATATPVVASRFGGADELVDHGENGFIVDPRDVRTLAETLRRLLRDPALSSTMGRDGRTKVTHEFTLERCVDAYLDLLTTVA